MYNVYEFDVLIRQQFIRPGRKTGVIFFMIPINVLNVSCKKLVYLKLMYFTYEIKCLAAGVVIPLGVVHPHTVLNCIINALRRSPPGCEVHCDISMPHPRLFMFNIISTCPKSLTNH